MRLYLLGSAGAVVDGTETHAEAALVRRGFEVTSIFDLHLHTIERDLSLAEKRGIVHDIAATVADDCDGIATLPDWETEALSYAAGGVATALRLPILPVPAWLQYEAAEWADQLAEGHLDAEEVARG